MRKSRLIWSAILLVGVTAGYLARFAQDDAFISFRYARNLAQGVGLVYNPGEYVEGYTNFLWTVLMAVPHLLGIDPVGFSQGVGLACFVGSLAMAGRLVRFAGGSEGDAMLAAILLLLHYSFVCYATGGLETQLQTFLVLSATCLCLDERTATSPAHALLLSVALAMALLTRLDSFVLLLPGLVALLRRRWNREWKIGWLSGFALPAMLLIGGWLIWKHAYYGAWLPNTARAKAPDPALIMRGLNYVYQFVRSYWMAPVALLVALGAPKLLANAGMRTLLVGSGLWLGYIVSVGGDFMEFRLFVPVLPFLFAMVVFVLPRDPRLRMALVGTMILGSLSHAVSFAGPGGIQPIRNLQALVYREDSDWRGVGLSLRRRFSGVHPPPVLATTAAGAVPYYSAMPTIDMLGLTDAWVARHGLLVGTRPGHRRIATTQYLVDRGVHLVLGHPLVEPRTIVPCASSKQNIPRAFELRDARREALPTGSRILLIPLGRDRMLRMLYLLPNAGIDAVIERDHLETCPVMDWPAEPNPDYHGA